ncbi:hypothetical protein ACFFRR_007746 [Megaselia abdita]
MMSFSILSVILFALTVPQPRATAQSVFDDGLSTQTIYGFLDFTTTIGNTVMVFLPSSVPSTEPPPPPTTEKIVINTKPLEETTTFIQPSKPTQTQQANNAIVTEEKAKPKKVTSKVDVVTNAPQSTVVAVVATVLPDPVVKKPKKSLTKVEVIEEIDSSETTSPASSDVVYKVDNDLTEPEYDNLSWQPPAYAEETYKVVNNVKPSAKNRNRETRPSHLQPTGLVTKLSSTVVNDDRYAQVLQSSAHILKNNNKHKISPTSTARILKTVAPVQATHVYEPKSSSVARSNSKNRRQENTPVKASSPPVIPSGGGRFRSKNQNRRNEEPVIVESQTAPPASFSKNSKKRNKHGSRTTTATPPLEESNNQRRFKPKVITPSLVQTSAQSDNSPIYKFKLNRSPGRWQYKTSPKPRVIIKKSEKTEDENIQIISASQNEADINSNDVLSNKNDSDLEPEGKANEFNTQVAGTPKYLAETLKVEISTPADFKDTYYEIATIKTPYTFQVGSVKNTRFVTVTSTFEKTLEPEPTVTFNPNEPLTENILATKSSREINLLDTSIGTLPPIYLSSDEETVPLETMTETYSTTQTVLKTQYLPVIQEGQNSTRLTLIQTYFLTRMVTATKTLPPSEVYQFVASKRLKDINRNLDEAGSEIHLELEFGDNNEDDDDEEGALDDSADIHTLLDGVDSELDIFENTGKKAAKKRKKPSPNIAEAPLKNLQGFSPAQLQQLALLGLINPAQASQSTNLITTSKPIIKHETVYETKVIPVFNGHSTLYSTISKSIGETDRIEYELTTASLPQIPQLPMPPPIPQLPTNPLFPQPQFQITTQPIVTQTVATQTQSKILKLTFGAKTAYTTIFSTTVVPTILTTYLTTSIPVQPTAAYPGYYPSPFAPYPFVG